MPTYPPPYHNRRAALEDFERDLHRLAESKGALPLARFLLTTARTIKDDVRDRQERDAMQAENRRKLDALRTLPLGIEAAMTAGASFTQATAAYERAGTPRATIEHYWKEHLRDRARVMRHQRNADIMRLAARGWTNKQIAERFGINPASVSRIVQARLRSKA